MKSDAGKAAFWLDFQNEMEGVSAKMSQECADDPREFDRAFGNDLYAQSRFFFGEA